MASRICRCYLKQALTQMKPRNTRTVTCGFSRGLATLARSSALAKEVKPATLVTLNLRDFHPSFTLQGVTSVKMPSLSPTMEEGMIVNWLKKEGDKISAGDVLCEIQTDKAVVSLEYDDEGVLAKILKPADSGSVKVGSLIALVVEEGDDWKTVEVPAEAQSDSPAKPAAAQPSTSAPTSQPQPQPAKAASESPAGTPATEALLGPAVRNLLNQYGLSLSQVPVSGSRNLVKGDVLRLVQEQNLKPVKAGEKAVTAKTPSKTSGKKEAAAAYTDIEITNMRRTIAKRLLQSKSTIPHAYTTVDSRINHIMALRKRMKNSGLKVSVNDFIIKSVANALGKSPGINVTLDGENVVQKAQVDISVAVATDSGLITPIVTDVAGKDILQISENVKELADKAKKGKLQPNEFMGGTFTISNLGMFGVHHFTAIINPPQCAILAVGGGHTYLDANGREETRLQTTLSYDARAISDVNAAKFLAHLKHELENPSETSMGIYDIQGRADIQELASSSS